jgi:drug/metabolite transporter (DMT)-like permease
MSPFVITIVITSTFMHAGVELNRPLRAIGRQVYENADLHRPGGFRPGRDQPMVDRLDDAAGLGLCHRGGDLRGSFTCFSWPGLQIVGFHDRLPVARSLPVILIAGIDTLRGRYLTAYGWMGILLVAAGCVLVPLTSFREISLGRYINRTSLWMLLTALGTVGYTFLDKVAAEVVQSGPATAARYGYFYFLVSFFPFILLLHFFGSEQSRNSTASWKISIPVAILGFSAYWLILWSYQLSPYAGYIYAFRQFSIVIGAVLAFIIYKEKGCRT